MTGAGFYLLFTLVENWGLTLALISPFLGLKKCCCPDFSGTQTTGFIKFSTPQWHHRYYEP